MPKEPLLREYTEELKLEDNEPVFADFISRRDFINRTGIYVSTQHFAYIHTAYKESGLTVDEFVDTYEKNNPIEEIQLSGTFKYDVTDENISGIGFYKDDDFPNIWEILNAVDMSYYHKSITSDKWALDALKVIDNLQDIIKKHQDELLMELLRKESAKAPTS